MDPLRRDLSVLLDELSKKTSDPTPKFDARKHKDETRSKIALRVVNCYFALITIVLIGIPIYDIFVRPDLSVSVTDILSSVAGIINGTFGFVVGYYFKGSERE